MYSSYQKKEARPSPSKAVAENSTNAKALPSVPVLQQSADLQDRQLHQDSSFPPVIQRTKFDDLSTPIGVFTGDSDRKDKVPSYDSEEEEVDEPSVDIPEDAQSAFDDIKEKLEALGWQLLKTKEREHCYTEVIRHYWKPDKEEGEESKDNKEEDQENNYDIPSFMRGEDEIPEDDVEKIVYYDPKCPLLDLIHEMDHVYQQEKVFETTGKYLFTNWDAQSWGGRVFGQMSTSVGSGFYSDENREFNILIRQKLGYEELSDGQNEYAEYHNYMLEYLRFCDMEAPEEEKAGIKKKVEEHRDKAKSYAEYKEDEGDEFIKACELIKPLAELESEYQAALDS